MKRLKTYHIKLILWNKVHNLLSQWIFKLQWLSIENCIFSTFQTIQHFVTQPSCKISQTLSKLWTIRPVLGGAGSLQLIASRSHKHECSLMLVNTSSTWVCFSYRHSILAAETQVVQVILCHLYHKISV